MKKLTSVFVSLLLVLLFSVTCFAEDRTVPLYLTNAKEAVHIVAELNLDDRREIRDFDFTPENSFNLVSQFAPGRYNIVSAQTSDGNDVLLEKYNFTVEDTGEAQSVTLNVMQVEDSIIASAVLTEPKESSFMSKLGLDFSDLCVVGILVVLVAVYLFRNIKRKKALEEDLKKEAEVTIDAQEKPHIKITEEDYSSSENNENE